MAGTVKVDDVAIIASQTLLKAINNDLPNAMQILQNAGRQLSDQNHWDGKVASDFRQTVWPQVEKDISNIRQSLADLQNAVQKVLQNISAAGGNG